MSMTACSWQQRSRSEIGVYVCYVTRTTYKEVGPYRELLDKLVVESLNVYNE